MGLKHMQPAKDLPAVPRAELKLGDDLAAKFGRANCPVIRSSNCVARAFEEIAAYDRELMIVGALDAHSRLLNWTLVSIGTSDHVLIRVGEVFHGVIHAMGSGVFLVHNHPSGSCAPSKEDIKLTYDVAEAGVMLGYPLVDHVIVARSGFRSVMSPAVLLQGRSRSRRKRMKKAPTMAAEGKSALLRWRCSDCRRMNGYNREASPNGLCSLSRCGHCNKLAWIAS